MATPGPEIYLQDEFNPDVLKVAQLRSILLAHGHGYPSNVRKADLVEAFLDNISSRNHVLRTAAAYVRPSARGIIAVSANGEETPIVPTKRPRASRRRTATVEPEPVAENEPEEQLLVEPPVKKPRGGRARKSVSVDPEPKKPRSRAKKPAVKVEDVDEGVEGEIEDEATPAPQSSRGLASFPSTPASLTPAGNRRRSNIGSSSSATTELRTPSVGPAEPIKATPRSARKSEAAIRLMDHVAEESEKEETPKKPVKPKTPRKSVVDESGFSDFNPFQSGSEAAADRERRRRKSSMGLGTIKPPAKPRLSEPGPSVATPILRRVGPSRENLKTPPSEAKAALRRELDAAVEYNHAVEDKLNQISYRDAEEPAQVTVSTHLQPVESESLVKRAENQIASVPAVRAAIPLSALFLLLLSLLANFKSQSSALGYCDATSSTNDLILSRQSALDDARACIARKAQLELDDHQAANAVHCDVSALPLLPFVPRPTGCTPCPPHAECVDGEIVACAPEYLLTPHPLSALSPLADGLPGVGPRAFPPSCRPDTAKKRMIGGLAKELEKELAKGRGLVVCAGLGKDDGKKGEGERFGVDELSLRERFAARRDPKFSREQFDEIFESALKDLVEHEDVIESIDINGKSWYAASRTDLTLGCRAKLETKDLLDRWKSQLGSTAAVIAAILYLQSEVKRRRQEKYRAEELAQVALKRLQDQEQLHYTDPVTTPSPFIPPEQLRDLVMPPKGSTASRSRLWAKVQDMVEANANVAVREREVKGEMWKTWEWAGAGAVLLIVAPIYFFLVFTPKAKNKSDHLEGEEETEFDTMPLPGKNRDAAVIADFRDITGASSADASKFVKKYKTLEASLDAYYNDPAAQSSSAPSKAQEKKLGEIWEKYKDASDSKLIKIEGTLEICQELDVDPGSDSVLFCLAADLGSKATGEWEKQPFVAGIASYPGNIDSLASLKKYLPTLRKKLNTDPAYFKKVYMHAFTLAKGQDYGARTLQLDTAIDLWTLFIPPALTSNPSALSRISASDDGNGPPQFGQEEFDLWLEFIRQKGKAVSKDTWSLLVDFIRSIDKEFKEYDDEGAWPSTIDDFVEFVRKRRG
ncbi:hypothetical protein I317_04044 [Kwoniella heveanensis CBS 569]|nr:hypothetical protein I317_04044 [Kwoniella heveanensis CBS 569]